MLISLNWIRDYVDLPDDLDPRALAERITRATCEVDAVDRLDVGAMGLVAARVQAVAPIPQTPNLRVATLNVGRETTIDTVTVAPVLPVGSMVMYAPVGASVSALGEIGSATVAGYRSEGVIPPGDALGIPLAVKEAVFLGPEFEPGQTVPVDGFDDWRIEIDNKSITHRPDLWGHYGMAREIAAMLGAALRAYPVVARDELTPGGLPEVDIAIADSTACRRYSGLVVRGVPTQPAPLWMQLRLGHVGMRPISGLVDLTNYVMADLGQPMHAFDGDKVTRIEVDWANDGELFRALEGAEHALTREALMIQCGGKSIALAGVMGGLETEVSDATSALLLESANFDAAVIRRTATRLGLRTDASARFEKSLDPANTVLAIQRFMELARPMYANMTLASRLSDGYPQPPQRTLVRVNPRHVERTVGRAIAKREAEGLLSPLGFELREDDNTWHVRVPSFRATGDVAIEADVIEEIARCIGYDTIEPTMPRVSMRRFEPHALHDLEQRTLAYLTGAHGFHEMHEYVWDHEDWLAQLGYDPGTSVEVANPAAEGLHALRKTLIPGLLAAAARNRFHFPEFSLLEVGGVFEAGANGDHEHRHLGLLCARRGRGVDEPLLERVKGAIAGWSVDRFGVAARFDSIDADPHRPWETPMRCAGVRIAECDAGRIGVVRRTLRQKMGEHLAAWGVAWAELRLDGLDRIEPRVERMGGVPGHPRVDVDVSFLVPATAHYTDVVERIGAFRHDLLKEMRFLGGYEGESVPAGRRSLTFRAVIGDDQRTLVDGDATAFRAALEGYATESGYEIR
jgi:phenylalanyl-tRNA synthetase beta chain